MVSPRHGLLFLAAIGHRRPGLGLAHGFVSSALGTSLVGLRVIPDTRKQTIQRHLTEFAQLSHRFARLSGVRGTGGVLQKRDGSSRRPSRSADASLVPGRPPGLAGAGGSTAHAE
jgi:hypothetical protein